MGTQDQPAGPKRRSVLIVEDNRADVFLIREAIQNANVNANLEVMDDGEKAIRFFERIDSEPSADCPDLVILDLNLPRRPGREVLEHIRQTRRCPSAFVVVVTSSNSERDRDDMARLGVSVYFRKPSEYSEYMKLGGIVKSFFD